MDKFRCACLSKSCSTNIGPESAPITDPTFWRFNIWDPGLSSTTTTTTTPPTTHTVTTLGVSTAYINTLVSVSSFVRNKTIYNIQVCCNCS